MTERFDKPPGQLGEYIGIGMAAMLLGRSPEQTGIVYDIIRDNSVRLYKVGGVSLIEYDDLCWAAGDMMLPDASPPWPEYMMDLPMENIYSRGELADKLNLSVGSIHRKARMGADIQPLDLSEWRMHTLYYYDGNGVKPLPKEVMIDGYKVTLSLSGGMLLIDVAYDFELEALCFGPEPAKAWFMDGNEVAIEVHAHKE